MLQFFIIKYFHLVSILILFTALVGEVILIEEKMTNKSMKIIRIIDAFYGISAVLVIITGLLLLFFSGKEVSFYMKNPVFHLKLTLFLMVALLSILPTIRFIKLRKSKEEIITIPGYKTINFILRLELAIVIIIPLLGVFVSNGYQL